MKNRLLNNALFCSLFLLCGFNVGAQNSAQQFLDSALAIRQTNGDLAIELFESGLETAKRNNNNDKK